MPARGEKAAARGEPARVREVEEVHPGHDARRPRGVADRAVAVEGRLVEAALARARRGSTRRRAGSGATPRRGDEREVRLGALQKPLPGFGGTRPARAASTQSFGHVAALGLERRRRDAPGEVRREAHGLRRQQPRPARALVAGHGGEGYLPSVRVVLYTGKGGVGKTTTAAATAACAAARGRARPRALRRPGPQPRRRARRASRARAAGAGAGRAALRPRRRRDRRARRDGAPLGRGARLAGGGLPLPGHRGGGGGGAGAAPRRRGARGAPRGRGAGAERRLTTSSSSTARRRARRCGSSRSRSSRAAPSACCSACSRRSRRW